MGRTEAPEQVMRDLRVFHGINIILSDFVPENTAYMIGDNSVVIAKNMYSRMDGGLEPPPVPERKTRYDIAKES